MATLAAKLGIGPVSLMFAQRAIVRLDHAALYVQALPYGRTSEPEEPLSVLRESIGTCTLKHALLKLAAEEAGATDVELRFGVFEMSDATTPGIGHVLRSFGLECVPEAHCYLAIDDDRLDFTGLPLGPESPFAHLLTEESLAVSVVLKDKTQRHKAIVDAWARERQLDPALVWRAREACIQELASGGLTSRWSGP